MCLKPRASLTGAFKAIRGCDPGAPETVHAMKTGNDSGQDNTPRRKLCSNCAYRGTCNKRFSAQVSDGQVRCLEHAFDVTLFSRPAGDDGGE